METLKDIKDALKNISDDTLEGMFFGIGEGTEEISLVAMETGSVSKEQIGFPEVFDKYPQIVKLDKLIKNIRKAQEWIDKQDVVSEELLENLQQEGITDTYFDKKTG